MTQLPIPDELGTLGVLTEPSSILAKAWEQIERISSRACAKHERLLVTGGGPIGLLAALMGAQRGLEVHVLDRATEGAKLEAVHALGVAIGSAVTLLDVERVVIGGGLGERLGPAWVTRIEKAAKRHTFFRPSPEYVQAALGDMGGAIGASLLPR